MAKAKATKVRRRKLPEMRCFVACDAVSREGGTGPGRGKVSLHGLFDVVWTDKFPGVFKPFYLFARLISPTVRGTISLHATGTDGKPFGQPTSFPAETSGKGFQDIVFQLGLVPLAGVGSLRFVLKFDGKQIGWPCEIVVQAPPRRR